MIINPNIQNGSIENFERKVEVKCDINDDEDEESEEKYTLHVGLVKLDHHKLNKFMKILEYLSIKRYND